MQGVKKFRVDLWIASGLALWMALQTVRAHAAPAQFLRASEYESRELAKLVTQIKAERDREPDVSKRWQFGDLSLLAAASRLLHHGGEQDVKNARVLQLRYVELLEKSGILGPGRFEARFDRIDRQSFYRYYARINPKRVSQVASGTVLALAMQIGNEVPVPDNSVTDVADHLHGNLLSFAQWMKQNPTGAADYLYLRRLFETVTLAAIDEIQAAHPEASSRLVADLDGMANFFKSVRRSGLGGNPGRVMHRWPRALTLSAEDDIAHGAQEEIDRIYSKARIEAITRTALVIAAAGTGFGLIGGSLAVLAPALGYLGWGVAGTTAAMDAFDRARSGDDAQFYSWTTATDVFFVASCFAQPIAKGIDVISGWAGAEAPVSEVLTTSLAKGVEASEPIAKFFTSFEKIGNVAMRTVFTGFGVQAIIFRTSRIFNADQVAAEEGKTRSQVIMESVGFLALRVGSSYSLYKDWKEVPEDAKKEEVDSIIQGPSH